MKEKALIKKAKPNIIEKICILLKNIFGKKENKIDKDEYNIKAQENIIDEIKKENGIIILQNRYENGKIKEKDLTENEKKQIFLLYKKQIEELEKKISDYNKTIDSYKMKIIEEKNKITN